MKYLHRLLHPANWSIYAKLAVALLLPVILPVIFNAQCRQNNIVWLVEGVMLITALLLARIITSPIRALTAAADAIKYDDFDAHVLELHKSLVREADTGDDIARLVRVFLEMSEEVRLRDQQFKVQLQELSIEIDESKKNYQVAEITENEYFQELQQKVKKLRKQSINQGETENAYYKRLQNQAQSLRKR